MQSFEVSANHTGISYPIVVTTEHKLTVFIDEKGCAGDGMLYEAKAYNEEGDEAFHNSLFVSIRYNNN